MNPVLSVVLTVVYIGFVVYLVLKKYNSVFVFLTSGIIVFFIAALVSGQSVMGDKTSGSALIDAFVYAKTAFSSNLSGVGLTLMMVTGYAMYMSKIGASTKLAFIATKPLSRIKNPYLVLSFLFIIGVILKLVITSASGHGMLLMSIAFPILISLGISPLSAATVVVMGSFIDWGPNDSSAIFAAENVVGVPMIDYFLNWQLKAGIALSVICAIFLPIWLSSRDKRRAAEKGGELQQKPVEDSDCPAWYALFPAAPLVLVTVFAFVPDISLDVTTANILCLIIVFLVELARKRTKSVPDDMSYVMKEMGASFARVVSILVGAAVFAKAIELLGGMTVISDLLASIGGSPLIVVAAMSLVTFFGGFILGSGNASWYAFGPLVPTMTSQMGIATQSVAVPMQLATGMGRSMSPVSGVIIAVSGMAGLDLQELSRSCMVPACFMFVCNVVISYLIATFL